MSAAVTVKLIHTPPPLAFRHDSRWMPWSWVAFTKADDLLATGRDRHTREEALADINALFGACSDVVLVESDARGYLGSPEPWPIRTAVAS